jgi:WD40 repeat protein/tetratricopeptide (TPR) repeat protein
LLWDLEKREILRMTQLQPLQRPDLRPVGWLSDHDRATEEANINKTYGVVRSLVFSPNGGWLAVVLQDGSVSLIDVATGRVSYRGVGHETDLFGKSTITAYFTRDGDLLTVGGDATVRQWDLPAWATGRRVILPMPGSFPVSKSWDPKGCVVLKSHSVMHWSPKKQRIQIERLGFTKVGPKKAIYDPAQALGCGRADGKVVLATARGQVFILDLTTGKTVEFTGPPGQKRRLPDRPIVDDDQPSTLAAAQRFLLSAPIGVVAVQPNGNWAASAWKDDSVDIWQIQDGVWVKTLKGGQGKVAGLAFSPDGRQLAVTHAGGELRLWDVESGKSQFPNLVGPKNAKGLCYSPDGQRLIQAGDDPIIAVWNPRTGRRLASLKGHLAVSVLGVRAAGLVQGAAYSPDGKRLATGGADGSIRLWVWDAKATTYQPVAVLSAVTVRGGQAWIASLAFTADSQQLVVVPVDGKVRAYDLKPIEDELNKPAKNLLAETESATGLRLHEDRQNGDRFIPMQQLRLAREGQTLRPAYEQDVDEFLKRAGQGWSLVSKRRPAEGLNLLESLLKEPGVPTQALGMARTYLANAYLLIRQHDKAEAEARKVLAANPNDYLARSVLANVYQTQGVALTGERRYPEARLCLAKGVGVWQRTLDERGLIPEVGASARLQLGGLYALMGVTYLNQGRFAQGRAELGKARVELDKASAERDKAASLSSHFDVLSLLFNSRSVLAQGYLTLKEADPLQAEIDKMLRIDPRHPGARVLRVAPFVLQRRFANARKHLEDILAAPDMAAYATRARLVLGRVYVETGEIDKAETEFAKLAQTDKSAADVLTFRAYLDAVQGKKLGQYEARIQEELRLQPDNPGSMTRLGWVLAKQGELKRALEILEKQRTSELMARDPVFWDWLGDVYSQNKLPSKARAAWEQAMKVFPRTADAADRLKADLERKLKSVQESSK